MKRYIMIICITLMGSANQLSSMEDDHIKNQEFIACCKNIVKQKPQELSQSQKNVFLQEMRKQKNQLVSPMQENKIKELERIMHDVIVALQLFK